MKYILVITEAILLGMFIDYTGLFPKLWISIPLIIVNGIFVAYIVDVLKL